MRNLFLLRGAPASGKSTWIKENELEQYTLSADEIRLLHQSPVTLLDGTRTISQNNDKLVWDLLLDLLEHRMKRGECVIIDATHYKSKLINKYKDLVDKYRYRVNVVDFSDVSEEELKRRNALRGFRKVPEDVIEKMVVALKDDSEVKSSYKIISPNEAVEMIHSPLKPYVIPENIEKVVVFGDIHGCYTPLKEYFDKNSFNENTNYIFCGDYLDRGIENREVLEFLISLKDKKNCVFLEGNHEKWLRIYSDKSFNLDDYGENKFKEYTDLTVRKIVAQVKDRINVVEKQINKNKNKSDAIYDLWQESKKENPENKEVYYEFEKINALDTIREINEENKNLEKQVKKLSLYLNIIRHEEYSTHRVVDEMQEYFKEIGVGLSLNIKSILKYDYNMESTMEENPLKSKQFLNHTLPQIKDIDKTEIRKFCYKLAQMSYFTFNGRNYLVTHGGLPCLPDMCTLTSEMINGVGSYEDHEEVDKQFALNTDSCTYQIHGHRNVMKVPFVDDRTFNLENDVEFGGNLRILEITKSDKGTQHNCIEIKNEVYDIPEEKEEPEKTDLDLLKEMYHSKLIQVKELKDNIISLNFTRDAFYNKKWNDLTCTARGLFVDKTNGNIVARSFSKFFNHSEVDETKSAGLKERFVYPVVGYKKENGFLGIVSKDKNGVHFFTKSSDEGDYVNWFIGVLCDNYGIVQETSWSNKGSASYTELYNNSLKDSVFTNQINSCLTNLKQQLIDKLNPLLEEGYSYVFECIDKDNDPHIIKYKDNKIVLLEVFKNQLKEEHVSWKELHEIADRLLVPCKSQELRFNNWKEFEEWKDKFTKDITQWDCKHEGYVFEDANGFRVKFKSSYYKFWKQMRSVKEALAKGKGNSKIYKTKEEIQVVKLMEELGRDKLKEMSIIDVEDIFYERYKDE